MRLYQAYEEVSEKKQYFVNVDNTNSVPIDSHKKQCICWRERPVLADDLPVLLESGGVVFR